VINFFRKQTEPEPTDTVNAQPQGIRGLPKMLVTGGVAVGGLSLLMVSFTFGGSLLSSAPTVGQPTVIALPEAAPSPTATAEPSTQTRDESGGRLRASVTSLEQTSTALDTQLRDARAQRWLLFAASRCQQLGAGGCSSPRSLLLDYYLGSSAAIQNKIRAGQIQVDSASVRAWREKISDLRDMAQALSLDITGTQPIPFVATSDVSAAIDGVFTDAAKFDSLRQQQQQQQFEKPNATPSPAPIQEGKE
jgi:hypothetical protein